LINIESYEPEPGFSVSPNPANNLLYLNNANGIFESIEVYSTTGQLLREIKSAINTGKVDVSSLPPGNYFVRAISREEVFVRKFVVVR
jgi:hypothetical protein